MEETITHITNDSNLIKTTTGEYPITYREVKARHDNVLFPNNLTLAKIKTFGYEYVHPTPNPETRGKYYVEGKPQLEGDRWVQQWKLRELSAEESAAKLAKEKAVLVKQIRDSVEDACNVGFRWRVGQTYYHIQLRDGDRANLASLRIEVDERVRNGSTDLIYFRTYENIIIPLTPEEGVTLTRLALSSYMQILAMSWSLQEVVMRAPTFEALPKDPRVDIYAIHGNALAHL